MAHYLRGQGVPATAIVRDEAGNTTEATALHAAAYMHQHGLRKALVASQYFHIVRTGLALREQGVLVVGGAYARYLEWRDGYSLAREVFAVPVYWLRSR